jgi:hypothetical protein
MGEAQKATATAPVPVQPSRPVEPLPLPGTDPPANLKLQGIFYRANRASALINGQTLFVGDEIEGVRLVAVERQSVRLVQNGRTNVMKLH